MSTPKDPDDSDDPVGPVVAAIDCGTNSTRLLVGSLDEHGRLVTHDRRMRITRLGQGVDDAGRLDPQAIARTVAVLEEYREAMDRLGAIEARIIATSAVRDSANHEEFFAAAETAVGYRPELITGSTEAALSFAGATSDLDPSLGPFAVMDIGGGSTEFAYGPGGTDTPEASISLDVGCVRMTEKYLDSDPPSAAELAACLSVIEIYLEDARREIPQIDEAHTFVGLAGTVTTAAAVEIGLADYDSARLHHFVLTKAAAEDVFRTLATERLVDRRHNPGLEAERADVIVGGLCVLVQTMRQFGFAECLVSEADILDGVALALLR